MRFLKFLKQNIYVPIIFFLILFFLLSYAIDINLPLIAGFSIFSAVITIIITLIIKLIIFLSNK